MTMRLRQLHRIWQSSTPQEQDALADSLSDDEANQLADYIEMERAAPPNVQHPSISSMERANLRNLGGTPQEQAEALAAERPDLDVEFDPRYNAIKIRTMESAEMGGGWEGRLEPDNRSLASYKDDPAELREDLGDIASSVGQAVAEGVAVTTGAGLGLAGGGVPGALVGGAVMGGAAGLGTETMRQAAGMGTGARLSLDPAMMAESAGIGALGSFFGPSTKLTDPVSKAAMRATGRQAKEMTPMAGAFTKGRRKLGEMVGGAPAESFELLEKNAAGVARLQKLGEEKYRSLVKEGVEDPKVNIILDEAKNLKADIAENYYKLRDETGSRIDEHLANSGVDIDLTSVRNDLAGRMNALKRMEKGQGLSDAESETASALRVVYNRIFRKVSDGKVMPAETTVSPVRAREIKTDLQNTAASIGKKTDRTPTENATLAIYNDIAGKVRGTIDSTVDAAVDSGDVRLNQLNQQYRNLMQVEDTLRRNHVIDRGARTGDIQVDDLPPDFQLMATDSPADARALHAISTGKLDNLLQSMDKNLKGTNLSERAEVLKAGQVFVDPKYNPKPKTSFRQKVGGMVVGPGTAMGIGGVASSKLGVDPAAGAMMGLMGYGALRGAGSAAAGRLGSAMGLREATPGAFLMGLAGSGAGPAGAATGAVAGGALSRKVLRDSDPSLLKNLLMVPQEYRVGKRVGLREALESPEARGYTRPMIQQFLYGGE